MARVVPFVHVSWLFPCVRCVSLFACFPVVAACGRAQWCVVARPCSLLSLPRRLLRVVFELDSTRPHRRRAERPGSNERTGTLLTGALSLCSPVVPLLSTSKADSGLAWDRAIYTAYERMLKVKGRLGLMKLASKVTTLQLQPHAAVAVSILAGSRVRSTHVLSNVW